MKKGDIRDKIKFEALIGLILLIVFVGIGAAMFAGVGTTETVTKAVQPAPAAPSNPPAVEQKTTETVQAGAGSDFELYYGEEPSWDSGSNGAQTDVTDDTTTIDDNSNSDDAQSDDNSTSGDVVDPGDIIDVDDSDISDDEPVPDDLPDEDDLGELQDVEFLDLVNTETGETFGLDDIADSELANVIMDPVSGYTLGQYLCDWILAQQESASYFDNDSIEVVDHSTEDTTSEVDFGDEDLGFAADDSQTDSNQDDAVQDDDTNADDDQNDDSDNLEPGDVEEPAQDSDNMNEPIPDDVPSGDDLDDWING